MAKTPRKAEGSERMKMRSEHLAPLASQVMKSAEITYELSGRTLNLTVHQRVQFHAGSYFIMQKFSVSGSALCIYNTRQKIKRNINMYLYVRSGFCWFMGFLIGSFSVAAMLVITFFLSIVAVIYISVSLPYILFLIPTESFVTGLSKDDAIEQLSSVLSWCLNTFFSCANFFFYLTIRFFKE